jgi:hypothetical protein
MYITEDCLIMDNKHATDTTSADQITPCQARPKVIIHQGEQLSLSATQDQKHGHCRGEVHRRADAVKTDRTL